MVVATMTPAYLPEWRNGRRGGLKILCRELRVGSSPTSGTTRWTSVQQHHDQSETRETFPNGRVEDISGDGDAVEEICQEVPRLPAPTKPEGPKYTARYLHEIKRNHEAFVSSVTRLPNHASLSLRSRRCPSSDTSSSAAASTHLESSRSQPVMSAASSVSPTQTTSGPSPTSGT